MMADRRADAKGKRVAAKIRIAVFGRKSQFGVTAYSSSGNDLKQILEDCCDRRRQCFDDF
jgi:hypothetical protein